MIKRAMLATKEINYYNYYSKLKFNDNLFYSTKRTAIINKLKKGDEIYIKVQGTGDIKIIAIFVKKMERANDRKLMLIFKKYVCISTKKMYEKYNIKAGAECGWINKKI